MTYIPRSSIAGADTSAPSYAKLPRRANQGAPCLTDDLLANHVYDASGEQWLPMEYIPFCYDTEVDGAAVGDIELSVDVPADTIILDGVLDVVDPFASAGSATLAIKVENSEDILAALAVSSLTSGFHAIVPNGSYSTAIKTTDDRTITVTVGTADFTGGKLYGYLRCFRGFPTQERSSSSSNSSSSSVSSSSSSPSTQSASSQSASSNSSSSSPSASSNSSSSNSNSSSPSLG